MPSARKFSALAGVLAATALAVAPAAANASWTYRTSASSTGQSQVLGTACTSSSNCLLVGSQSGGTNSAYVEKWNGSVLSGLTPSSTTSELYGVGCNSTTLCDAVGTDISTSRGHIETYNGSTWSGATAATPTGSTFTELDSVACPSSTLCLSVGHYTATTSQPLIEKGTPGSWATQTLSLPAGTLTGSLNSISCTSTSACTAVGNYTTLSTDAVLILRYNGSTWTSQTGASGLTGGSTHAELDGVSCTGSSACHAVGSYLNTSGVQVALSEVWNGSTWTQKSVPVPSGSAGDSALSSISCYTTTTSGCIAVGGYPDGSSLVAPEAAVWNGSTWTQQTIARPAGATETSLNAVTCTASTFCIIGGTNKDSSGNLSPAVYTGP